MFYAFHSSKKTLYLVAALFMCLVSSFSFGQNKSGNIPLYFIENKGQVGDQFHKQRADILFAASDGQMVFHLKNNGISYQQYRIDKWEMEPDYRFLDFDKPKKTKKVATQQTVYRTDVEWINCNSNCVIEKSFPKEGYDNYYMASCENGATEVHAYQQLLYKNIYNGIDLKWYTKSGHLKYDYIVEPGADYKAIKLSYSGAESLSINANGELVIATPLGKIIEQAPVVKQNNRTLKSKWVVGKNTVSFFIEKHNPAVPLIIDPGVRMWGTYYGGAADEVIMRNVVDGTGNVYASGYTNTIGGTFIATVGSHQISYGGGIDNAFLVKFNSAGVRQWGTYYGGPVREWGLSCALDPTGANVYMAGNSLSGTGNVIATPGAHQTINNGGFFDAFLVKFNSNGIRQWGTYYGDTGSDFGSSCATDALGNVYLAGKCTASTGTIIGTPGSHQPAFGGVEDAFLVKFNSSGVRQWGTHYGDNGVDNGSFCVTDAQNNVYLSGITDCTNTLVIATAGAHQTTYGGGGYDAFIAKFNSNGVRQLGTYYGGAGEDRSYGCAVDANNDVYLAGKSVSGNNISTIGSHQAFNAGGAFDGFLVRFNSTFKRKWGTFYGSPAEDAAYACFVHTTGHIYLAGFTMGTTTTTLIATPGSHQSNFGGGVFDGFIAQFDTAGVRTWGSYYGEIGDDLIYNCYADNLYNVYVNGTTNSSALNSIASVGSHQAAFNGGWSDGFVAKFYDCPAPLAPTNTTSASTLNFCAGGAATLNVTSTGTVSWFANSTTTTGLGTGTTFITSTLSAGTHTFFAEAKTCTLSASRTAVSITVNPLPNLNIVANPTLVCSGKNTTLTVSGAATYTWDNSSTSNIEVMTPAVTSIYTVIGTSSLNCNASKTIQITVYPLDPIIFTAATYTSCLTIFGGSAIALTGSPTPGTFSGPNVSGPFLNPTALGIFNPVYTYTNTANSCVNSATISIEVFSCLGVNENDSFLNFVLIYPNPTKGAFVLQSNSRIEKTISITDIRGRVLKTIQSTQKNISIDISDYAPAIYLLKLSTAIGAKEFKLIKE